VSSTLPAHEALLDDAPLLRQRADEFAAARPRVRAGALVDRLFGWAARGAALLTLGLLAGILVSLVIGAAPAIEKYGLGFFTSAPGTRSARSSAAW
jgi:phosphate transport system permease protein